MPNAEKTPVTALPTQSNSRGSSFLSPVLRLSVMALGAAYALYLATREHTTGNENDVNETSLSELGNAVAEVGKVIGTTVVYASTFLPAIAGLAYHQRHQASREMGLTIAVLGEAVRSLPMVQAYTVLAQDLGLNNNLNNEIAQLKTKLQAVERKLQPIQATLDAFKRKYEDHLRESERSYSVPFTPGGGLNSAMTIGQNALFQANKRVREQDWANFYAREHDNVLRDPETKRLVNEWETLNEQIMEKQDIFAGLKNWQNTCNSFSYLASKIGTIEYLINDQDQFLFRLPRFEHLSLTGMTLADGDRINMSFPALDQEASKQGLANQHGVSLKEMHLSYNVGFRRRGDTIVGEILELNFKPNSDVNKAPVPVARYNHPDL